AVAAWTSEAAVPRRRSATRSSRRSSSAEIASGPCSSSATDALLGPHLLGVDLLHRHTVLVAGDLALGCVRPRDGQVRRGTELLGDGQHPLDQLLERRTGPPHLERSEVDELAREPRADGPPQGLLAPARRHVWEP